MSAVALFREIVTVVDVLETGACLDGVAEFVLKNGGMISARVSDFPGNTYIHRAGNGYGNGYGYGYGIGYGIGYGDGDGYGTGYGDGDGYGDGY